MRVDKVHYNNFRFNSFKKPVSNNNPMSLKTPLANDTVSFTRLKIKQVTEATPELIEDYVDEILNDENFNFEIWIWGTYVHDDGTEDRGYPVKDLDLLKASEEEIKDIADCICLYRQYDIAHFCKYSKKFLGIKYGIDSEATATAYMRLHKYIEENKREVKKAIYIIHNIEQLKIAMLADVTKQKDTLSSVLIDPIKLQSKVKDAKVPNGIILYGSNEAGKDEIYYWLKEKSGLRVKTTEYNPENPQQSIDDLKYYLEEAEKVYQTTNIRTVLDLDNFDTLLTNNNSAKDRRMIAQFKNIAENATQKYHTTLLLKTDKSLENFEPSSIGMQRFEVRLQMDEKGATQKQNEMYEEAMEKLRYFAKRGIEFESKYMDILNLPTEATEPEYYDYLNFC